MTGVFSSGDLVAHSPYHVAVFEKEMKEGTAEGKNNSENSGEGGG